MNTQRLIVNLERIVRERTPEYESLDHPRFDEKLLKAHYLLARLHSRQSNTEWAHSHFRKAESEFYRMCEERIKRAKESDYFSDEEGLERLRARNRAIEKE